MDKINCILTGLAIASGSGSIRKRDKYIILSVVFQSILLTKDFDVVEVIQATCELYLLPSSWMRALSFSSCSYTFSLISVYLMKASLLRLNTQD